MNALSTNFQAFESSVSLGDCLTEFRSYVLEKTGIKLSREKESLVRQRLNKRVHQTGSGDLATYLDHTLHDPDWSDELDVAIDMMTTNTTYFFREEAHFDFLAGAVVPDLAADAGIGAPFQINIWSVASSEGAEAFTAAMVLSELKSLYANMSYAIVGTDISSSMVTAAQSAIYRMNQIDKIPEYLRRKYLLVGKGGEMQGKVRFAKDLRKRVKFFQMNLKDAEYPVQPVVDVAFLRNVLIYFGPEDQAAVIDRVVGKIKRGGYLFVGHSESMIVDHEGLIQIQPSVYRKA